MRWVRVRERQRELMILNLGEIHPEESKQIPKRLPIDNAQTEKLVDAGNRSCVFDLRQPSIRYAIVLVLSFFARNPLAICRDITSCHSKPDPNLLEAFARTRRLTYTFDRDL